MTEAVELVIPAALVLCVVRLVLVVRPAPSAKLPHPSKVPGLAMAGPASPAAAHAAINRRRAVRPWWQFWT